jgi:hypothetical protein
MDSVPPSLPQLCKEHLAKAMQKGIHGQEELGG